MNQGLTKSAQLWLWPLRSMLFWPCIFPGAKWGALVVGQPQTRDDDCPRSQNSKFHTAGQDFVITSCCFTADQEATTKKRDRDCVSTVLYEKHSSESVMRVKWVQGYQKVGSYIWLKGQEVTPRKDLQGLLSGPVRSAHKRCTWCVQTQVQNVFLHYHYYS